MLRAILALIAILSAFPASAQVVDRSELEQARDVLAKFLSAPPVYVKAGEDLQAVVDRTASCDVIELEPGAVFQALTIAKNEGPCYRVIRTRGQLPKRRVTPADAWQMATIRGIRIPDGVSYIKVSGVLVQPLVNTFGVIRCGNADGPRTLDAIPHHIEFDQFLILIPDTVQERRGIQANCSDLRISRCTIANVKEEGADTQAISAWDTPGRIAIDDCALEAAGEVVLFGGSDPSIVGMTPTDIILTNSTLSNRMSWRGSRWQIKNLLEFKHARNVTVENVILDGIWAAAQYGYAVLLTPRNQGGTCPWCTVENVTIRNVLIRNAASGFSFQGWDNLYPTLQMTNVTIEDVTMFLDNALGDGRCAMILAAPKNVTINHTSCFSNGSAVLFVDDAAKKGPIEGFVYTNNVHKHNLYGIIGSGTGIGMPTITAFFSEPIIKSNVFAGVQAGYTYPPTNTFPSLGTFAAQFAPDGRLKANSAWKNDATDGGPLGARTQPDGNK